MRADALLLLRDLSHRRRLPVERITEHARRHGVAVARVELPCNDAAGEHGGSSGGCAGDAASALDRSKLFTCWSLAPLSFTPVFAQLTPPQQRRYNQLVALMQNEIICFFEQEFADRVLPAMLERRGGGGCDSGLPRDFADCLRQFAEDERQHTQMFRRLNRLAEPRWYADGDYHILRIPRPFRAALRQITTRPGTFPMVFWVMLLMEERSLMIGRRYAAADAAQTLEPHFAATYRAHLEDEIRHVHLDWHLLERFYQSRPAWVRKLNARLLEAFVVGLFLKPRRANVRLIDLLIAEFPELAAMRPALVAAVRGLHENPAYRDMMYSEESTPIARSLLETFPELHRLRDRLYRAEAT